jgi:hypothetical protein
MRCTPRFALLRQLPRVGALLRTGRPVMQLMMGPEVQVEVNMGALQV